MPEHEEKKSSTANVDSPQKVVDTRWSAFFRQLIMATVVVVLFQLLLFPRLCNNYRMIDSLRSDQRALARIKTQVDTISAFLESGKAEFDVAAEEKKNETIDKLRKLREKNHDLPLVPISAEERSQIENTVVKPLIISLKESKKNYLIDPFVEKKKQLEADLNKSNDLLVRNGIDVAVITHDLETVQRRLALPFAFPEIVPDYDPFTKERALRYASDEIGKTAGVVNDSLKTISNRLASSIDQSLMQSKKLTDQIAELEKKIQEQAKAIPFGLVDPDDILLYYPVLLAATCAYFAWRFLSLRGQTVYLLEKQRVIGANEMQPNFDLMRPWCFLPSDDGGFSVLSPIQRKVVATLLGALPLLFWLVSVVLIMVSRATPDGYNVFYFASYSLSGLLILVTFIVITKTIWNLAGSVRAPVA